ncbi:hypothetical protein FO440_19045 [Mucilaginibacter corticis]|uniref:Autotransporter outer membrane beta-barrel domain-containing protein n=1 Tax=Mucilaginibacter corticis TaxID=2597670 RepID=A0A556MFL8_9SPHI|nr:DUF6588 family protein [Mucilaginibacter corticis]TSJ38612.1 hypothetical protein FO440_19045 [Mucilaginibacter corticis]
MKKIYSIITLLFLTTIALTANAQDDFSALIKSSPGDATKLFNAYGAPLFKGFGVGLNSGWNNTAKTKKFLHFDVRISVAVAEAPTSDKTFDVTKLGLSKNLTLDNSSPTNIAQTFAGDKNAAQPVMSINDNTGKSTGTTFQLPQGVIKYVPAPNVQLTIGLVRNTDLTIRATPTIKISDDAGSVGVFGFGIKHDLTQYLIKKGAIRPFDLAFAVNYNRIKYTKTLDVQPDGTTGPSADFSTQHIDAALSGFNLQAIISKKFLFFTPFVSVGYQTASTNLNVLGNYPVQSTDEGQNDKYVVITDPVHINQTSISGLRGDLGFQIDLGIRIYASYSISGGGYNSANAGIGFGF